MNWIDSAARRARTSVWIPVFAVLILGAVLTLSLSSSRGLKGGIQRLADLFESGGYSEWRITDDRGELRYVERDDGTSEVEWNGDSIPLDHVIIEDGLLTLTDVRDAGGDLLYDRVPLSDEADRRLRAVDTERRLGVRFDGPPPNESTEPSVRLRKVESGEPAALAGLRAGDVVTAIEGQPDANVASLRRALGRRIPGGALTLTVRRSADTVMVDLVLPSLLPLDDWRTLAEESR